MNELEHLVNNNFYVITHLFGYGVLPHEVHDETAKAGIVTSKQFTSLESIKSFLSQTYLSGEVDRLINCFFDNRGVYFEKDGQLFVWADQIPGAGYFGKVDQYQISLISRSDKEIVFEVRLPIYTDPGTEAEEKKYIVKALYENGWKLTELFG